jgi:hypothetical protein
VTADDSATDEPSETQRPDAGTDSGFRSRGQHKFALRFRGRDLPLIKSDLVVGRSEACDLVLDGPLVSRRHARFVVTDETIVVEDLGSRNGVFVNSIQIARPVLLKAGDVVMVGDDSFEVVLRRNQQRSGRITASDPRLGSLPPEESSMRGSDAFELLRSTVERAFASQQPEEAERVLRVLLEGTLDHARAGKKPPPAQCRAAASYAAKLAAALSAARYLNYPIELYFHLGEPLPVAIVDELYPLVRRVHGFDRALLRRYVALLRSRAATFAAPARFALQRIEGLERLAAL